MPHKRYKHSKCHQKRPVQTPYKRYKRCERHKGLAQMPINATHYATPRHAMPQKTMQIQMTIKKKASRNAS